MMRTQRAFTTAELLIAIAIISIASAILLSRVDYTTYRLDGAARGLRTTIQRAQSAAVTSQHNELIAFDVVNQRVYVIDDVNNNLAVDPGERITSATFQDGVVFGSPSDTWAGAPTPAAALTASAVTPVSVNGTTLPTIVFRSEWCGERRCADLSHLNARAQYRLPGRQHHTDHGQDRLVQAVDGHMGARRFLTSRGGVPNGMTLIETLVAVTILATAMIGMAEFMANFAHATKMSAVQAGALDLATQRIDSVMHSLERMRRSIRWPRPRPSGPTRRRISVRPSCSTSVAARPPRKTIGS